MRITITGDLGSGKSLVSRLLSERLGLELYSTGSIQREIAAKRGISTLELNKLSESQPEIDDEIDGFSKDLGAGDEAFIMDSRLAWHFVPNSLKCYLKVDPEIAARRILEDGTRRSEKYADLDAALRKIEARKGSEHKRFKELYGVDCGDMANYDIVLDTSSMTPREVVERVLAKLEKDQ